MNVEELRKRIEESVNSLAGSDAALAYSGGIDSSVIAAVLRPELYTVAVDGSFDASQARKNASLLGLETMLIGINGRDIEEAIPKLASILDSTDTVEISYLLPLYFVCSKVPENTVLTGQGADELFGSYHRYEGMDDDELESALKTDVAELLDTIDAKDGAIARHFGKSLGTPFLSKGVVGFVEGILLADRVDRREPKSLLRRVARSMGVPEEICRQPKKAAQYSSGIMKAIKALGKEHGLKPTEYVDFLVKNG